MGKEIGTEPTFREVKRALSACHLCTDHVDQGCESKNGCPAGLPVSQMIRLVLDNGELGMREAARLAVNENPLLDAGAEACNPCQAEIGCRNCMTLPLQELHKYLIAYFLQHQEYFIYPDVDKNGKKVAVIGDGPAAITAAIYLAAAETEVAIYSKGGQLGGLLNVIPRVQGTESVRKLIERFPNIEIMPLEGNPDRAFESEVNGVLVATGLQYEVPNKPNGERQVGEHAVSFIKGNDQCPDMEKLKGKRVLIIGGGKTANDAAFLAKRLGAEVEICYRRDIGSMDKYEDLMDEGMTVTPLMRPETSDATEDGTNIVTFRKMKLAKGKDGGKKRKTERTDDLLSREADIVLWATPGRADTKKWAALERRGLKVKFAGDLIEDKNTVANAVGSGRASAESLMTDLGIEPREIFPRPKGYSSVEIAGKKLETPFIVAAVPTSDANNYEMARRALMTEGCSGLVVKTVTFDGPVGIPAHYMDTYEVGGKLAGMFNSDNISNAGITASCETVRRLKAEFPGKFIAASIMSPTVEGWGVLAKMLKEAGADLVECSFSCPQGNITATEDDKGKMLGQNIGASCAAAGAMIEAVGRDFPVSIKIPTSGSTDFISLAKALRSVGIKYITCANSVNAFQPNRQGDGTSFHPNYDGFVTGVGFTGAAILPSSLDCIKRLRAACPDITILGTGGVYSGDAARQLLLAGANVVEVGSGLEVTGMDLFKDCNAILEWYLHHTGLQVHQIIGKGAEGHNFEGFVDARDKQVPEHGDDCIGCGKCATICNDGQHAAVTRTEEGKYKADPDKCEGCGNCAEQCPAGAIRMVDKFGRKEGQKG